MSGQGTVTIGELEWTVELATTWTEITTGLGGRESLDADNGMLFDMGSSTIIIVTTEPMLFNLDVIFIECISTDEGMSCSVSKVVYNAEPGIQFEGEGRYFLEVNAGEADDVEVGDEVDFAVHIEESLMSGIIDLLLITPLIMGAAVMTIKATKDN